jgi:beta-glucosidase
MSYTSFKYTNLKIHTGAGAGAFDVSFDVTNTGKRAGADVAQVYVSEDKPSVPRPPQELKGFARVVLDPGQTRHVTVTLEARSFTWYDEKAAAWHADAGSFTIHVSRSSADPQLEGKGSLDKAIMLPVK